MSEGKSWTGDWKKRLYERVHGLGYESLTDFSCDHPTASTVALAEKLGKEDINAVQIVSGLLSEAEQTKKVSRFIRDMFVRHFYEYLPNGWPDIIDDKSRFDISGALSTWISYIPEATQDRAEKTALDLMANPPPARWKPFGPNDELLIKLFPDEDI